MTDPLLKHGRFFDVWSKFYRVGPIGLALRAIQRKLIDGLHLRAGHLVLDLGCGPGDGCARIAATGATAVGLDYSQGMLLTARDEPALRGRLVRGDAGRLPFVDGAFDFVVCTNSFHHYPSHFAALKEMRRVLKPGGTLALADPRRDHLFGRAAIDGGEHLLFGLKEVRVFSLRQWERMLVDAGFASSSVEAGPWWNPVEAAEVFVHARAT